PVAVRFDIALQHARLVQEYDIDPAGAALEFRKHLGWYVKGLPGSAELRKRLHQVNGFEEVEGIFSHYLAMHSHGDLPADDHAPELELLEAERA
ncbi:MAG TPA: hypothetical protein VF368_10360, partial [Gemmatimonadaceae bacterium]